MEECHRGSLGDIGPLSDEPTQRRFLATLTCSLSRFYLFSVSSVFSVVNLPPQPGALESP